MATNRERSLLRFKIVFCNLCFHGTHRPGEQAGRLGREVMEVLAAACSN